MSKKIKILTLSDHPFSPSGVGTQTKYIIEGMLATGKYQFISLGGAIKHQDYRPQKTEQWKDDWTIYPVDGYGTPHAVDTNIFKRLSREEIVKFKKEQLKIEDDRLVFFWNNRNARRKQSGSLLWWFAEYLNKVGKDKATLIMHTDPKDPNGQDLIAIMNETGLTNREVLLSQQKVPPQNLAYFYNAADATINISDAEGFGLATLESLACETPIIVTKTGGLQDQIRSGEQVFGIEIVPSSRAVIGSQDVPYIYEDRISNTQFVEALEVFSTIPKEQRQIIGQAGRQHVIDNFSFDNFISQWDKIFTDTYTNKGSWPNKTYKGWELKEI